MADELILRAEPRSVHGKKVKALRREGLIPGVVYGPVVEGTVSVSVNRRIFDKFFMANGHSTVFSLEWDGGKQPVLIREVQRTIGQVCAYAFRSRRIGVLLAVAAGAIVVAVSSAVSAAVPIALYPFL